MSVLVLFLGYYLPFVTCMRKSMGGGMGWLKQYTIVFTRCKRNVAPQLAISLDLFTSEDDSSLGANVHVINLEHVSDLELLSQSPQLNTPLPEINLQRVRKRMEQNIEAKWKEVNSRGVGVSKEAQLLFDSIRKM